MGVLRGWEGEEGKRARECLREDFGGKLQYTVLFFVGSTVITPQQQQP